jgi:hypothetical protein
VCATRIITNHPERTIGERERESRVEWSGLESDEEKKKRRELFRIDDFWAQSKAMQGRFSSEVALELRVSLHCVLGEKADTRGTRVGSRVTSS